MLSDLLYICDANPGRNGLGAVCHSRGGKVESYERLWVFLIKFSEVRKSEKCNLYHFRRRWRSDVEVKAVSLQQ